MSKQSLSFALVSSLVLAACTAGSTEPSAELRKLGITQISITESDRLLSIEGLDHDGRVLATARLELGQFYFAEYERHVTGRQLAFDVLGLRATHQSEGYYPLFNMPFPRYPEVAEFANDPQVATALARWGIGYEPSTLPATRPTRHEVGYGGGGECATSWYSEDFGGTTCAPSTFGGCATTERLVWHKGSIVQQNGEVREWRCCPANEMFAERACIPQQPDGPPVGGMMSSCGTVGPAGCSVCHLYALNPTDPFCDLTDLGTECQADWCPGPVGACAASCDDMENGTACGERCDKECYEGSCLYP